METESKYPRGVEIAVGVTIENEKGEILVVQSPKYGSKWVFPGGHIEPNETVIETAVREGKEETNLELQSVAVYNWGELINSKDFHRPAHFVYFDVYCKIIGGELKLDGEELISYKWVSPKEALSMDIEVSHVDSINKFIEYKSKI